MKGWRGGREGREGRGPDDRGMEEGREDGMNDVTYSFQIERPRKVDRDVRAYLVTHVQYVYVST